jgi:hypothetical protein
VGGDTMRWPGTIEQADTRPASAMKANVNNARMRGSE